MSQAKLYAYLYAHPEDEHTALGLAKAAEIGRGGIYNLLIVLEKRKHLSWRWEPLAPGETRRPHKLYKLTEMGYSKAEADDAG